MKTLSQSQVGEIIFSHYNSLLAYALSNFQFITKIGGSFEELVNEAVVNVFDCPMEFSDPTTILLFVKNAIKIAAYREKDIYNDANFITKKSPSQEESSILDKVHSVARIKNIFELFSNARFGTNNENKFCLKCRSRNFYGYKNGVEKCTTCGYYLGIRAQTYISNSKLSFYKLYLLVRTICNDKNVTSVYLSRYCEVTQKTAWSRQQLILSVIDAEKSTDIEKIIKRILTPMSTEKNIIEVNKKLPKFSPTDLETIRRTRADNIYTTTELAKIYNTDPSTIAKIGKGLLYNNPRRSQGDVNKGILQILKLERE